MTKSKLEEQLDKPVEIKGMFATEATNTIKFGEDMATLIDNTKIPTTKEGKPNIEAYMNKLVAGAEPIVGKYFGDKKDPQWTVGLEQLKTILDTYENPIKEGRLREAVRNAIVDAYKTTSRQYSISRATARGTRIPIEDGKNYARIVAHEANPALEGLAKRAMTPEQLQRALGTVLPRLVSNVEEAYTLTGKVPPIVKTAEQYAKLYKN